MMQAPATTNSYHAVIRNRELLHQPDQKSVFKLYYVDIIGRANPERTEWDACGLSRQVYRTMLETLPDLEGIGFITAFPHITKAFRFGPEAETVMNVRAWSTKDLSSIDLSRSANYVEYACLAEAAIAADEFDFWAAADSVESYLEQWSEYREGPIARHDKLRSYWS